MNTRYHNYFTEQTFFIQINPAEIRNNNLLVAAIDDFIENHISLEIFSEKCGNSVKGAPAMHASMEGLRRNVKPLTRITSKDCILSTDDNRKTLTCPGGFTTETGDAVHDHGNFFYRFYIPSTYCANCGFKNKCHTSFKTGKSKWFNVKREYFDSQLARGRMRDKPGAPEEKQYTINSHASLNISSVK